MEISGLEIITIAQSAMSLSRGTSREAQREQQG